MQTSNTATAPNSYAMSPSLRSSTGKKTQSLLLLGADGAPDNYKLTYAENVEGQDYTTPRHRHNFDQIRYVLGGEYALTKDLVVPEGSMAYVAEGTPYGPQVQKPHMKLLMIQFGGATGHGFITRDQRRRAYNELIERGGTFENGIYKWRDAAGKLHQQDAFEACWEQASGAKIEYPRPRYRDPIIINPDNFDWVADESRPGVYRRHLGSFTEREVRVCLYRLMPGSSIAIGTEPASEVMFLQSGRVTHQDETHTEMSAFGTGPDDGPEELVAVDESVLFYVKLPSF